VEISVIVKALLVLLNIVDRLATRQFDTREELEAYYQQSRAVRKELVALANSKPQFESSSPEETEALNAAIAGEAVPVHDPQGVQEVKPFDPTQTPLGFSDTLGAATHSPREVEAANNARDTVEEVREAEEREDG